MVVNEAGECPDDLTGSSALRDMMKSHPEYGEPSTLVPFAREKLKILQSTGKPKMLKALLPPAAMPLLRRWKTHIELTPKEVNRKLHDDPGCCPPKPYWDPILRHNKAVRTQLIVDLWRIGVISFRTSVKAHVGLFFVRKKDPSFIRMVIDCRISNAHHRNPPVTRLGGGANFAGFDLSPDMLSEKLGCPNEPVGFGAEMDVSDCFYQFQLPEIAKWFGINDPRSASDWRSAGVGFDQIYDEDSDSWTKVSDSVVLYPVINAMPMGWTWALFFANETVSYIANKSGPQPSLVVREKLRVPQLWEAPSITSTYVDNVSVFGAKFKDVKLRMEQIDQAFAEHEIPVVWTHSQPCRVVETVGVIVDFDHRVVRNKPSRLWKVFLAGREICRRSRIRSDIVEVWLGHATSVFRLFPPLLSVFTFIYRFVTVNRGKRVELWPAVRAEIRQACSLIWFARSFIGGPYCRDVDMGDSSGFGYAMTSRDVPASLIHDAVSVKERWRFIPVPDDFKSAVEFFNSHPDSDGQDLQDHIQSFVRSGVGLDTEYGQWLQRALEEGSWLKTSAIRSQIRASKRPRDDIEIPELVKPISGDILVDGSFRLLWMRNWRNKDEAINIKEGRVCLSSLKRSGRILSHAGCRKLTLCDNLSTVLALEKGRSNSIAMNRICKTSCSLQIALQIRWFVRHVETKRNQADRPSRGLKMRRPFTLDPVSSPPEPIQPFNPSQPSRCKSCHPQQHVRQPLLLCDVVPPPGLGKWHSTVSRTQVPLRGDEQCVRSAVDDFGHSTRSRSTSKGERQQLRVWEIFCGEGNLTKYFVKSGLKPLVGIDIRNGDKYDLTVTGFQQRVLGMIRSGHILYVHLGTPCTVFSRARRNLKNLDKARHRELVGCELAFFTSEVARLCSHLGVYWSIENPRTSRLWEFPAIEELLALDGASYVDFTMCGYGQPFKKPTRILTNCPALKSLACFCNHGRHAEVLKGRTWSEQHGWVNRTSLAGAYPNELCKKWVQIIRQQLEGCNAPEIHRPVKFEKLYEELQSQRGHQSQKDLESFPFCNSCPKVLDSVAFGQHSKAEVERRRKIRQRQKKCKTKTQW